MKLFVLFVSCLALAIACLALCRNPATIWQVKDSKGRVRMELLEEGESIRLALLDSAGRQRITLALAESGLPSLALFGEGGEAGISCRGLPVGGWDLCVRSAEGHHISLGADQGKVGLVSALGGKAPCMEMIAEDGGMSALTLSRPDGRNRDAIGVFCGQDVKNHAAGLLIGDREEKNYRAGLVSGESKGTFFLGVDKFGEDSSAPQVLMKCDKDAGAYLSIPGQSGSISLNNQPERGIGLMVEMSGKGHLLLGGSAKSELRLRALDASGSPIFTIPER
jgi:hypothetical protein